MSPLSCGRNRTGFDAGIPPQMTQIYTDEFKNKKLNCIFSYYLCSSAPSVERFPSAERRVDHRGVEPRPPGCKPGVIPLDEQPIHQRSVRESNPALRLRRPPCVRHTRGERAECPCQESNLVFDLRGVACRPSHAKGIIEADGRARTGIDLLTRQEPHHSATSAVSRGARI